MNDIYKEIENLVEVLKNQEDYVALKKVEKEMREDLEVLKLSNDFSLAQSEYNACLNHYSYDSDEAKKYQKKLHQVKYQLDTHPRVLKYTELLSKVNEPLWYLEYNLLSKFKK